MPVKLRQPFFASNFTLNVNVAQYAAELMSLTWFYADFVRWQSDYKIRILSPERSSSSNLGMTAG